MGANLKIIYISDSTPPKIENYVTNNAFLSLQGEFYLKKISILKKFNLFNEKNIFQLFRKIKQKRLQTLKFEKKVVIFHRTKTLYSVLHHSINLK